MQCDNKDKSCTLDMGRGCEFCNCGEEYTAGVCEGCFKLHATDWLGDIPNLYPEDIFEVRFKNTRRSYYKNVNNLPLKQGDIVAVEASPGHDIGIVSLTGDIVARQMKRVGFSPLNGEFKKIYRKAKPYDIEKWQEAIAQEHETMIRSRQIAAEMGLNMKIGDVEYQGDKIKAIFYYIADERVDFRELIKVFADQFRIRVEMKQIGARQEAGRIGGLGSCGRELCCASWIANFVSVTTNAARTQEISLNPQKLAGQCSKLKCCLVYELDSYIDARKDFPRVNQPLQALDGEYYLVKSDILAHTMSFSTSPHSMIGVITLPVSRVKEILAINRRGEKADKLEGESVKPRVEADPGFVNVIGEESITRFDKARGEKKKRSKRGVKPADGDKKPEGGNGQPGQENRGERGERGDRKRGGRGNEGGSNKGNNGGERNRPQERKPRPEQQPKPEGGENRNRNDRGERSERGERGERSGDRGRRNRRPGSNNGGGGNNGGGNGNSGNNPGGNQGGNPGGNPKPGNE